ncbi:DUF6768 family protein [Candidatus Hydrogenedentota bacterium]
MDDFDKKITDALGTNGNFDIRKALALKGQMVDRFNGALKKVERHLYVWLLLCVSAAELASIGFCLARDTKGQILWAILLLIAFETTILLKLWYWIMNDKISVMRELKLLNLELMTEGATTDISEDLDMDGISKEWSIRARGCSKLERGLWMAAIMLIAAFVGVTIGTGRFWTRWVEERPRIQAKQEWQDVEFDGTLDSVGSNTAKMVYIVPTQESDKKTQKKLHKYVESIRDMFSDGAPVVTDEEALSMDLSSKAIRVYGTPEGNLWLKKYWDELPIKLDKKSITGERKHPGGSLRCIASWPNPQNPKMEVAIYTAQRTQDIIGISNVYHGATDFVIADPVGILEAGYYHKNGEKWTLGTRSPPVKKEKKTEEKEEEVAALPPISIDISVDPRVELLSIIFRLAQNPEYNKSSLESYVQDVDQHFEKFKGHPAVMMADELQWNRGVGYDAPMNLAVRLTDIGEMKERISFDDPAVGLDKRWRLDEVREFVGKMRQFAVDTNFDGFFKTHKPYYDEAVSQASQVVSKEFELVWFEKFYGAKPGGDFRVALGMLNGPCNYGASLKLGDKEELYCILGVSNADMEGVTRFNKEMMATVAHEFAHSFVNPLVYGHETELRKAGEILFPKVKVRMKRMAYGNWATMMHESLVRASVVRYLASTKGDRESENRIREEINNGFLWMWELSNLLMKYESEREQYPTFEAFFPEIIKFFDEYGAKFDKKFRPKTSEDDFIWD